MSLFQLANQFNSDFFFFITSPHHFPKLHQKSKTHCVKLVFWLNINSTVFTIRGLVCITVPSDSKTMCVHVLGSFDLV